MKKGMFYVIYLVLFFAFIAGVMIWVVNHNKGIMKEAPEVVEIDRFCNNLYEIKDDVSYTSRASLGGYVAYSICVKEDGVKKYVGIDGIPVETNNKYVKMEHKYCYAIDEMLGLNDDDDDDF